MKKYFFLLKNPTKIVLSNGASFRDYIVLRQFFIRLKPNLFKLFKK